MTTNNEKNIDNNIIQDEDVFVFPASYGQKRMWFLDQFEPGSPYYNIPVGFIIKGRFNRDLFIKTINIIVDRHESIRTTFTSIKGEPHQVIIPELVIEVPIIDLTDIESNYVEAKVKNIARTEARKPFDLAVGPLFRVKILKLCEEENVILITMHHIISDGWSMGILVHEITSIYSGLINNRPIELEELEIQYADFSEWQNEFLTGEVLNSQLSYWKKKLSDSNSLLDLPTDRSRQEVFTNNGGSLDLLIDEETIDGLQKLSNSENATMFMTLLAAFNILLYRYSGQEDINVGTPIANRTDKEIEKVIGLFINTLVLRTQLSGNPTFRDLLKQVRKTNLEAFDHQDLPFEILVDAIQPERNMSYAPLFQVMMILQNNPVEATQISDIEVSMIDVDLGTSTSDLTYSIAMGGKGATCSIEYNSDLFDESTIVRMFNDFKTLLNEIISNPNCKISEYNLIDAVTQNKILKEWGNHVLEFPKTNAIHSFIEKWAGKSPDKKALVDEHNQLTYKELNDRANKLAHYLVSLNLDKSRPIAVSQNKTVNSIITILGILKAGYAYLPLDPQYPAKRLKYMIEDSWTELLIIDDNTQHLFNNSEVESFNISSFQELEKYSDQNLSEELSEDNLAYIIYTSGSTGNAKGVMITHRSLINYVNSISRVYDLSSDDTALQFANISFDISVEEIFSTLCNGATLVLRDENWISSVEIFLNKCEENKISVLNFPTAYWHQVVQEMVKNNYRLPDSVRAVIIGGEKALINNMYEWEKIVNEKVTLFNTYGPTETTVVATYWKHIKGKLTKSIYTEIPIGTPVHNLEVYILDNNLNIVPVGAKGELYVGGAALARGYLNNPDLTAKNFIPNLYSSKAGERLYRTGDIVKYLPSGEIQFIGRNDAQVKIRGFRVELGEIEKQLNRINDVKESVVKIYEDSSREKKIIAYCLVEDTKSISVADVQNSLKDSLPDYMFPSAFKMLEKFPLTENGKVNVKALPEATEDDIILNDAEEYLSPRNETEKKLVTIWEEVLNLKEIGIKNNFFLIGGHSLLATQIISRIKTEFNIDLPLRLIFEKPTIVDLSLELEKLQNTDTALYESVILPRENNENIPLSFAQERLWFLDQLEPNSPFYNIPEFYRIKGDIDLNVLEVAFNKIVERHESLRTYFISKDGIPSQVIVDELKAKFEIIDLIKYSNEDQELKIKRIIKKESKEPISINELPLFRIKILILDKGEYIIALNIHHIISDAWSSKVMVSELGVFYETLIKGITPPIPELSIQYADYSIWQRDWLKDEVLDKHIDYWKNKLNSLPSLLELPIDYPRPKVQTFNGDFVSFEFDKDLVKSIIKLSKEESSTTFMLLLAVFKLFLYKLSGQKDICVGTPNANRNRKEIESLIGFFVNTLALRTDCSGNPKFNEFLKRIKETTLSAYAHQDLPFETIVDVVNPERNLSHSPIFQVMFVHQNASETSTSNSANKGSAIDISPVESHSKTAKFDLTLFIVESDDEMSGAFEFNSDLFNRKSIEQFIEYFKKILKEISDNKSLPIENIVLLNESEQKDIIHTLNNVGKMAMIPSVVPFEFNRIAGENKDKIAVELGDNSYTFENLNNDSNRLANLLISNDVKSEAIIGICLPRSYELIVSLFGVLKSGAAYLPIDPNYPKDRINYILQDAKVTSIITESSLKYLFEKKDVNILLMDNQEILLTQSDENPNVQIEELNICYVIYTSGSTGNPKGTLLTHKGFANYISWTHHGYPFNQEIGSLVHSTVSFDATVTSIFPSLLKGKKIVLMKETEELDELANVIKSNNKFSILKITPAHLELLSNLISEDDAKSVADAMIIGGENLTSKQIKFWQQFSPCTNLYNEYGPTEAVVGCIVYDGKDYKNEGSVPIGKVIPNVKIYVLGNNLEQISKGVIGELYIGGPSLARGYLNKPELTAERFIPNPFAEKEGERIYKTGDLVKILPDGNIMFMGRVDDQVKVRGYRIELGEIESKLILFDAIKEVVVDVKDFGDGDKRIIAYAVVNSDINQNEILEKLKNDLPDYMIPTAIVRLDAIPLTINGKVDRKKLPMTDSDLRDRTVELVLPNTDTEKSVHVIWQEILKTDEISIYDNFFDLGGHSLLVTKLVVRLEKHFDISLPIRSVFAYPTIAQLAREIDLGAFRTNKLKLPPLKVYSEKDNIPLSFTQRRLWFLDKLDPGESTYNMPMAVKVTGKLDVDLIKQTVDFIANRHETLRTNFKEKDGVPYQIISNNNQIKVEIEDLSHLEEKEQSEKVLQIKKMESLAPFNLEDDSLIRFRIAKLSEIQFVIYFTMHHIISDGWSINIVMQEFVQIYLSLLNDEKPSLPDLQIQYSDYAIWQKENLEGEVLDSQVEYWVNKLQNLPNHLELPTDNQRPLNKTFNGSHKSFTIESNRIIELEKAISTLGITPYMFLLGAFQILLSKLSGQQDISVGTPVANRRHIETEALIGFFANTLVIRNNVSGDDLITEYFEKIKGTVLEAFENQDAPFEKLVEILKPERDLSNTPLFQVMFVLQDNQNQQNTESNINIDALEADSATTQYAITLSMSTSENEWAGTLEYNTDLFEEKTITKFIDSYLLICDEIINNTSNRISDIEYLDQNEKQIIIRNSIGKKEAYNNSTVLEKFSNIVQKYSNKTACEYCSQNISYSELDERSNRICNYLHKMVCKKENVIGVMLPRSIELIEWLLGIMKAGCCYMPIDINYPKDRINYMIEDSCVKLIITDNNNEKPIDAELVNISSVNKEIENLSSKVSEDNISEENLAYLIYTSGSTGKPKGVMLQHKGLLNLVENQIKDFYVTNESRVLQFASISFDASISEIFMALLSGSTLVLEDKEKLSSAIDIQEFLIEKNISVVTLPPSLLQVMNVENLGNIKTLISAGEKLTVDNANKWNDKCFVKNAYGPTEATVGVSSYEYSEINPIWGSIPIGKPIDNIELFVLDKNSNVVRNGTIGEIHIGGISLARGYINKPDLTAEKFIPNPFSEFEGSRLYKTGDLGRQYEDGTIEYIGRIDEQIKLRGFRIELSEIESVLMNLSEVKEAVAIVNGNGENAVLVAFLKMNDNIELNSEDIKSKIKSKLPDFMIPGLLLEIDEIPITSNGKVDRKKLPSINELTIKSSTEYCEPQNETESRLHKIWSELLNLDRISIKDNFFELGGHSLLSIKLINIISKEYNIELPLITIFKNPTIEQLAKIIGNGQVENKSLIQLNNSNSNKKLFLVHPSGGSVHWYLSLAEDLSSEMKVYGLRDVSKSTDNYNYSIYSLASNYVKLILSEIDDEEIIIGGWSLGVAITLEIMQQLKNKNVSVKHALLFDQGPHIPVTVEDNEDLMLYNTFNKHFDINLDDLQKMERNSKMKFLLKKAKKASLVPIWIRLKDFENYVTKLWQQNKAWQEYIPQRYSGNVSIFLSEENHGSSLGWEKYLERESNLINVAGDHISMLSPENTKSLAAKIIKIIEE